MTELSQKYRIYGRTKGRKKIQFFDNNFYKEYIINLKKDIDNRGVSILEVSNTTKEYIREMNKLSFKNMISSTGSLYLNLIDGYDTTLVSKMIYKIVDINKTMHVWHQFIGEGKKLTYKASDHERLETTQLEKDGSISYTENYDQKAIVLWYISGSYEKLTILRKWLVDNYKKNGIKSLAMSALGCGNGGLDWKDIGPLLYKYLGKMNIPVEIYYPPGTPEKYLEEDFLLTEPPKITDY